MTLGLIRIGATVIILTSFGIYVMACLCGASLKYTKPNAEDEYTAVSIYLNNVTENDIKINPYLYTEMIERAKTYNNSISTAQAAYDNFWINWTSRAWTKDLNLIDLPKGG